MGLTKKIIQHIIYCSYFPNFGFVIIFFSCVFLIYYYFLFSYYSSWEKNIIRIYKHSQSQLWYVSFKALVCSYSASQTSSSIKLKTTSTPSVRDKKQNNLFLFCQNSIHNDESIKNNDDIQSYETARKQITEFQPLQLLIFMHNILLPHPWVC